MFRSKIREIRMAQNMKQSEFAEFIGVGTSTVSGWEVGSYLPNGEVLKLICNKCHVSADYLLDLTDSPQETNSTFSSFYCPYLSDISNITKDEEKLLNYYKELSERDQDYIKGIMVRLIKKNQQEL